MGYMHYYGRGPLCVDMEKAYRFFSKAALLGDPSAVYKCGDMYLKGQYVGKDEKTAFSLYCSAFCIVSEEKPLSAYPDICRRIATCLHKGLGVEIDLQTARNLMAEAVGGFEQRLQSGDRFTQGVLAAARAELEEIESELAYTRVLSRTMRSKEKRADPAASVYARNSKSQPVHADGLFFYATSRL